MSNQTSTINDRQFFQFETDFVESLHCIPMQVRLKLDTCGVKLKLTHWHQLSKQERQVLIQMPGTTPEESKIYRDFLQNLLKEKTGAKAKELALDPHPPWLNAREIPTDVRQKAAEFDLTIEREQWETLTPLQRFALIKLSRPSHENKNFLPAIKEFGLTK
ncbi:MAG: nitrate reductase associated protein [Xenococcaceae cyanobacterium MO_188.B32]|nr:nitrate reductase associated protein [Xenococcaceae cyanobacterium MO_188.B32]